METASGQISTSMGEYRPRPTPTPNPPPKKGGPFVDSEVLQKTLENFNFATTTAILIKLTTNMYLNKVFHLSKYWRVTHRMYEGVNKKPLKISQKISFFSPNFDHILTRQ